MSSLEATHESFFSRQDIDQPLPVCRGECYAGVGRGRERERVRASWGLCVATCSVACENCKKIVWKGWQGVCMYAQSHHMFPQYRRATLSCPVYPSPCCLLLWLTSALFVFAVCVHGRAFFYEGKCIPRNTTFFVPKHFLACGHMLSY